jgi:hypothetical protein
VHSTVCSKCELLVLLAFPPRIPGPHHQYNFTTKARKLDWQRFPCVSQPGKVHEGIGAVSYGKDARYRVSPKSNDESTMHVVLFIQAL